MLTTYFERVIEAWFGGKNDRPFIEYAIERLERSWNDRNVFVVEAPTGYGKSTISATVALYSIEEELKSIIAFPLRTLLEDQYGKFRKIVSERSLGKRYMHEPDSRYLIKPVTLTTVDTLSMTLFGIPPEDLEKVFKRYLWDGTGSLGHYLFSWASVVLSNVVLDEVHLMADSTKSLSFLIALMRICIDFDQRLILMSATIPDSLKSLILNYIPRVEFIEFRNDLDPKFCEERMSKDYEIVLEEVSHDKYDRILNWIDENDEHRRVIVVFNTVADAIEFYNLVRDRNAILLHSRFSERDREKRIRKLRDIRDQDEYLIVSTQVIEAGVDVSSDLFITELAPANSLVQRLGRFLRYDERKGRVIVWYEGEDGKIRVRRDKYKVYDGVLTQRTLKWLIENSEPMDGRRIVDMNVHLPKAKRGFKDLLNYVYGEFEVDRRAMEDFERIFLHLDNASRKAVEVFFRMEGSFVREGLIVPVVSKDFIDPSHVVPVSFETFKGNVDRVVGVLVEEDGDIKRKEVDDYLRNILERPKPRRILRYLVTNDVVAFVVDADYDEELGLRFEI